MIAGVLFLIGVIVFIQAINTQQNYDSSVNSQFDAKISDKKTTTLQPSNIPTSKQPAPTFEQTKQPQKQSTTTVKQTELSQKSIISSKSKPTDLHELELAVFNEINNVRQQYGIHPLRWDDRVADVARKHSEDLINRNYFSHTSPEGKQPWDRMAENNVDCLAGENIIRAYVFDDAKIIVESWMDSEGHRKNILNSKYDKTGIGIVPTGQFVFVTQNFCLSDEIVNQYKKQPEKITIDFWP
jgi:uncharacterized protein YkwD